MTVKQCTKEELLRVIDRMCFFYTANEFALQRALCEIERDRFEKQAAESDRLNKLSYEKRMTAIELLKPYRTYAEAPLDMLKKAQDLFHEAEEADAKWNKLNGITIKRRTHEDLSF